MPHRCPGPACEASVSDDMLACRRHWYQVPAAIRNAVYRAWDHGLGSGSVEHARAMEAAIDRMQP